MRNAILLALAFLCTLQSALYAQSITCTFGVAGTHSEGNKILKLSNGNYAVGGFVNQEAALLVVDAQCNIIYQRIFSDLIPGKSRITDLLESPEGQLVAVGDHCADCTAEYLPNKSFVLRTDLSLQPDLATGIKSYGLLGCCNELQTGVNSSPRISLANEGNYLMMSNVGLDITLNPQDVGVMRLDANLDTMWTKTFHNGFFETPTDIEPVGDGYLLTLPRAFSTPYLAKINNSGELVWSQTISDGADLFGVEASASGNVYTAGSVLPVENVQAEVSVWSSAGTFLNSLNYGDPMQDIGRDIQQADNGGLVTVSTSVQPNPFGVYVQSRVHRIDPVLLNVLDFGIIPNPDVLTNVVAHSIALSNCDGSNYAATGFQHPLGGTRILFVHIHVAETLPFAIEAGSTELCAGESTQLTATVADSYLWSTGETTQNIVVNGPGNYSVAAQVGCHAAIAQIEITGINLPVADFSPNVNGISVQFENNSTFSENFHWSFGDGGTSTNAAPNHQYAAAGAYLVRLIATNVCGSDTTKQTITIILPPVAGWTQSADSGCESCGGFPIEFTATPQGAGLTYAWTFEGGLPASSDAANPSVIYANAGTYGVTLTVSNTAGAGTLSMEDAVIISPAAVADFAASFDGFTAAFTNNSTNSTDYLWTFGDGNSSTEASPVHTYAASGNYTVVLVANNDCGVPAMQVAYLSIVVGLQEPDQGTSNQACISPNPARTNEWLTWNGNTTPEMKAYWYDTTGKLLNSVTFSDSSPSLRAPERNGAYLLKVVLDNGVQHTCKVIIE
jgi:PKD repeat protein